MSGEIKQVIEYLQAIENGEPCKTGPVVPSSLSDQEQAIYRAGIFAGVVYGRHTMLLELMAHGHLKSEEPA